MLLGQLGPLWKYEFSNCMDPNFTSIKMLRHRYIIIMRLECYKKWNISLLRKHAFYIWIDICFIYSPICKHRKKKKIYTKTQTLYMVLLIHFTRWHFLHAQCHLGETMWKCRSRKDLSFFFVSYRFTSRSWSTHEVSEESKGIADFMKRVQERGVSSSAIKINKFSGSWSRKLGKCRGYRLLDTSRNDAGTQESVQPESRLQSFKWNVEAG